LRLQCLDYLNVINTVISKRINGAQAGYDAEDMRIVQDYKNKNVQPKTCKSGSDCGPYVSPFSRPYQKPF